MQRFYRQRDALTSADAERGEATRKALPTSIEWTSGRENCQVAPDRMAGPRWLARRLPFLALRGCCNVITNLLSVSDLREATVDEQFGSGDITCVVRSEKHHGPRDLIGSTEPAERHGIRNELFALRANL